MNAARGLLKPSTTAVLICDVQLAFAKVLFAFDRVLRNQNKLLKAARILNIPMLAAEQNPKSLGKTVPELDLTSVKGPFSKMTFSMCTPEINAEIATLCSGEKPKAILIIGDETHVCVENTVIDLRTMDYEVHVIADCCTSRTQEDRLLAFERMRQIGCHVSTTETVIFKLMASCEHSQFKEILSLVKNPTEDTGLVSYRGTH